MPPLPGEERILTTYADVHYFFSNPLPHPQRHRFDKGSYLYIYHDGAQHKTRIEIANNPGTSELDAFCGSLDSVRLSNSDKFPTRCTLTVDGGGQSTNQTVDGDEWLLNPRDGSSGTLRLHTLDVYFWTLDDAKLVLSAARRLLHPGQLDIALSQEGAMSSVVQNLENAAVSDPNYRNSQMRTPGAESLNSPPPPPALSTTAAPNAQTRNTSEPVSPLEPPTTQPSTKPSETPQSYAPLAYNPAAPAAPEPVKHREKTPPPEDVSGGHGPAGAYVPSHGAPSSGPPPPNWLPPGSAGGGYNASSTGQQPYASPPPSAGLTQQTHVPPHTTHHNPTGSLSFAPPPTSAPASGPAPTPPPGQLGGIPYAPPPQDPNMHISRQQSFGQQPPPTQYNPAQQANQPGRAASVPPPPQLQPPVGGYAEYSYNQPPQQPAPGNPYTMHSNVYRPTEAETAGHYRDEHGAPPADGRNSGIMRVEKGVNRLFKKLEKKL